MSTGYGWEGLRQVCATLLGACNVPERPCGGLVYSGRYNKCSPLPFSYFYIFLVPETFRHSRPIKPHNIGHVHWHRYKFLAQFIVAYNFLERVSRPLCRPISVILSLLHSQIINCDALLYEISLFNCTAFNSY